ncbi:endonuclease NucS domain-containing protein, partial [Caldicellulosiruptor sp. F32]|uniref:endonuclease NucS domain-containing protein n=1 Tax=Caldicellulosiruptor sp. F32 TaxID=1214564 RepID=UPI000585B539
ENLPPWSPITFRESGKTYYFPFRLILSQERILDEPMVRPEFSYIAENLLLRGGYRKTHFQADAITFYNVSNMGVSYQGENNVLTIDGKTFEPKIVFQKKKEKIPERFCFRELILQSLIKKKIRDTIFRKVMEYFNLNYDIADFEFLSEKALPEGYVDIFVKLKHPVGSNKYILIEVKAGKAQNKDIEQLRRYINELKSETVAGLLIAQNFPKNVKNCINESIIPVKYFFDGVDREGEYSYSQLLEN